MLALIKDNAIVNDAVPEGGILNIPEALVTVSPAQDGWTFEDYRLAAIVTPPPPEGFYSSTVELVDGVPTVAYTAVPIDTPQIDARITSAPDDLFGGPTLGDIFNGN
ncbi:hypothetical protein [Mesorhizobium sp.]|uniref:hypothetical protein n=1 Tax=Mesorhizobium sp. TaxID=1871066 RepID=UPI000FE48907|nr:hypothetical protein [Mesorhizobium sp.]RWP05110.1 MAG: hypothetical protein EOQ99_16705 [Mesorhizobium sp.]